MKKLILITALLCNTFTYAQDKKDGYIQLPAGVEYKLLHDEPGDVYPKWGDNVEAHMYVEVDGKRIYNSREVGTKEPLPFVLKQMPTKTDIQEVIVLMTQGDSVSIRMSVDSMLKTGVQPLDWMKPNTGQKATYIIKLTKLTRVKK
jgi:hypothetical protein